MKLEGRWGLDCQPATWSFSYVWIGKGHFQDREIHVLEREDENGRRVTLIEGKGKAGKTREIPEVAIVR